MKMLTLHRQAPVAPGATRCRLCDAPIAGTLQDHLLAGQPGTTQLEAAICPRCGETLRRLVEIFGPELCFVLHEHRQAVDHLIGGPAARTTVALGPAARAEPAPPQAEPERARQQPVQAADSSRAEQAVGAEADKLTHLRDEGELGG